MATNKTVQRTVKLYIDDKEIDNSANAIKNEIRKLTAEMNKATIGSQDYVNKMKQIGQLNTILDKHKADLKGVGRELDSNNLKIKQQPGLLSMAGSGFSKYASMATGAIGSIIAAMFTLNKMHTDALEEGSSAANLKALTGLDDKSIDWLRQQAVKLSTTMDSSKLRITASAKDILEAYTLVGSAKPELLGDKDALNKVTIEALRMAKASKMDVQPAVAGLTLALNQYGAGADEAAKYVNVLAAGSKFGSAEIDSQTVAITKAGVAASTAKIPIEQLEGSIQTLAEKGIKDEVAGTGLKTFFLKLEAGAKETRPSVVGLQTALERLRSAHLDAAKMVDMFGLETYTVAQAMIGNADKVAYYTKAVTGTNAATEQAAINSDTLESKQAQLKNKITAVGIELANKLNPAFNDALDITDKIVSKIPAFIDLIIKNTRNIVELVATLTVYKIALAAINTQSALYITLQKAAAIATTIKQTAIELVILATSRLNGQNALAIYLERSLTASMMAFPGTWLVTALTALIAVFLKWEETMSDTQRYARELNDEIAQEKKNTDDNITSIKKLLPIAKDVNQSVVDRKTAISNLKRIMPDYFKNLDTESAKQYDVANAIAAANLQYRNKLLILKEESEAEYKKAKALYDSNQTSGQQAIVPGAVGTEWTREADKSHLDALKAKADAATTAYNNLNIATRASFTVYNPDDHGKKKDNKKQQSSTYKTPEEIKAEEAAARKAALEAKRATQKALDAVDAEYTEKQNKLSEKYMHSATMTQQEYQDELERIELDGLEKKLTVAGIEPKKREEIAQKIMSAKTKLVDKLKDLMKIDAVNQDDMLQSELDNGKKKYDDALALLDYALKQKLIKQEAYEKAKAKLTSDHDKEDTKAREKDADKKEELAEKGYSEITKALRISRIKQNITDEQYDKIAKNTRSKWLKDQLKNENLSAEKRAQLQQEVDENELSEQEDSLKKKQDLQKQYDQIIQDSIVSMGTLIGEQIGNILKNGTVDFHTFLRGILTLLIDAVEKSILATRAALLAQNLLKSGWVGLASFTLQTALITAAFEVGKAAAQNFYDGGFTPDGNWDEPQGIVHSNEFVANRYATRNPNLLPILHLMDAAQRSGSVSNLTAGDITSVLPATSNQVKATTVIANNTNNNLIIAKLGATLADLKKSMDKTNKIFSSPITAETYATGRHGILETESLVTRMNKNVSRNA